MHFYILEGHIPVPVDNVRDWSTWYGKTERHVACTTIGEFRISTVFIGLDHGYGQGPPLVFETMVFRGASGRDLYMRRCSTWEQAEDMHRDAVAWVGVQAPWMKWDEEL